MPQDPSCPWGAFAPPDLQHCEANLCGWITTPANTWSNLAFIAAAVWLWRRKEGEMDRWFAWVAVGLGVTSFALHATFTMWGQYLDYLGMFPYVLLMLALNLRRLGAARWRLALQAGIPASAGLFVLFHRLGVGVQWIMVAIVAAVFGSELVLKLRGARAEYRPWLIGVGFTMAGVGVWVLDYHRVWCMPDNHFFQFHAAWHCFCALAIPFVARFYARAEWRAA